jgi:uncharacterized repeat protein (TIGR01451 family)
VNLAGATVTLPANPVLGGTTVAINALTGATSITVPYDGNGNADVNGIAATDHIVIGANEYIVQSVAKNSGANTATLTLDATTPLLADVAAGTIIGERQTFAVTVTSGTVQGNNTSGTVTVTTTATSTSGSHATPQGTATVVTVDRPMLTVTKTVSIDGGTNFAQTASAPPGTTLVYKIVAHNGGTTPASSVTFADVIPAYLTYVSGQAKYATSAATTYSGATALTEGLGGYNYTGGTRTVDYVAPGTVAGGGDLVLFYSATIN